MSLKEFEDKLREYNKGSKNWDKLHKIYLDSGLSLTERVKKLYQKEYSVEEAYRELKSLDTSYNSRFS